MNVEEKMVRLGEWDLTKYMFGSCFTHLRCLTGDDPNPVVEFYDRDISLRSRLMSGSDFKSSGFMFNFGPGFISQ